MDQGGTEVIDCPGKATGKCTAGVVVNVISSGIVLGIFQRYGIIPFEMKLF
jgi:hypothetical protein